MSSTDTSAEQTQAVRPPMSDSALLTRFVRDRNDAAFRELVERYSRLVFAVALRVVRDRHAAEDVFQSTFFVLARDAARLRRREAVASWLHGTALRLARKSLRRRSRLRPDEATMLASIRSDPFDDIGAAFDQQVLDEELQALPAVYREPLTLHYLQSLTYVETAEALGVSVGAIEGRLRRGKRELQLRLARRGVGMSAALGALCWSQSAAQAAVSPGLIQTTIGGGLAIAQGTPFPGGCSSEAVHLAARGTTMLTTGKLLLATTGLFLAAAAGYVGAAAGDDVEQGAGAAHQTAIDSPILEDGAISLAAAEEEPNPGEGVGGNAGENQNQESQPREDRAELRFGVRRIEDYVRISGQSEEDLRILVALEKRLSFEFPGNPLDDVMSFISAQNGFPILLDHVALNDEGLTGKEEVRLVLSKLRLKSGLRLLLRDLGLTAIIENETLTITTLARAERTLVTRVYDVTPLRVDDPESLANVIQAGTSGNWPSEERDEISGQTRLVADEMTGSIGYYNGSFVIRQTHQVHEEIAQLLDNLAEQITSKPPGEEWSFPTSPPRPGEKHPPRDVGGMGGMGMGGMGGMGGRGSGFY